MPAAVVGSENFELKDGKGTFIGIVLTNGFNTVKPIYHTNLTTDFIVS